MSLEHWAWLGIAAQPGNRIVDDILRFFPDPDRPCGVSFHGGVSYRQRKARPVLA